MIDSSTFLSLLRVFKRTVTDQQWYRIFSQLQQNLCGFILKHGTTILLSGLNYLDAAEVFDTENISNLHF